MNYTALLILTLFPPFEAFNIFSNMIISNSFLYKTYTFNQRYINKANKVIEVIVQKYFEELYQFLKEMKYELWSMIWMECVYTMFLKTFNFEVCLKIWDFILVFGIQYVMRLIFAIFSCIDENLSELDSDNLYQSVHLLIMREGKEILAKSFDERFYEYEFYFIKKLINKMNL
jgi:hypothetical protein